MEVNEDEPAHESDELVMSDDETSMQMPNIYTEARPADSDTCSAHSSQAELASLGYADDDTHEVEDVEESKDEPAANMKRVFNTTREVRPKAEKRVFDRENAVVEDGKFICNKCKRPVCSVTQGTNRNLYQYFTKGAHKDCDKWPYLKQK